MRRTGFKNLVRQYGVLLLAPLLLLGPLLARGMVLFWGTPALQFTPWWTAAWRGLLEGVLPLWNPLNGMGAPLLANYQSAFLYPPNWLLLVFAALGGPANSAAAIALGFTFLAVVHLAWAGVGMAALLRRLGFGWLSQMVGGLAFGLAGYTVARLGFFSMVWVAAWLPWVIYYADAVSSPWNKPPDESPRVRLLAGLVFCLAMQLLAGHAQLAWYSMLLAGVWVLAGALMHPGQRLKRATAALLSLGAAGLLAAAIAAPQLITTFEYLRHSQRADAVAFEDALTYSYWPWRLVSLAAPDFFGSPAGGDYWGYASYWEDHLYLGITPLLLALGTLRGLFRGARRQGDSGRWGLTALLWAGVVLTFILAMGRFTPLFPFLYQYVPGMDMFQAPARYLIWAAFALPVLAAVGAERWRCPTGRGLYWFRLFTAGAFAITLGAGAAWLLMDNIRVTFIRSLALAGMWALGFGLLTLALPYADKMRRTALWQAAVIGWILADLLFAGWSLNPGVRMDFFQGQEPARVPAGERVYIGRQAEYELKFHRFLRFQDFTALEDWRGLRAVGLPNLNLLDSAAWVNNFDPLVSETYARWMEALDGMHPEVQASWLAWAGVGAVERVDVGQPGGVRFDPLGEAQRARWTSCARAAGDSQAAWQLLESEMAAPVRAERAVILEGGEERACPVGGTRSAAVDIIDERADRLVLRVDAPGEGWVELMDSWYPGWQATVNGQPAPVLRADGHFRAVAVPPGKIEIVFTYRPSGFYFGALFSILVLLCTGIKRAFWGRNSRPGALNTETTE